MRFREVPAEDLSLNPMTMIGGGWWLIGAGNEEAGRWLPTACSFGYDKKYVDLAEECDDKEHGKINLYYGALLVFFLHVSTMQKLV